MKKYIIILITSVCFSIGYSQTLFTENFNNYPLGNFHNDFTGQTPTTTGWYTLYYNDPSFHGADNADFQIVAHPNATQNHFLYLGYLKRIGARFHHVFRNDIKTFWQQRSPGNNVLKLSFDIYAQEANNQFAGFTLSNSSTPNLIHINFDYSPNLTTAGRLYVYIPQTRGNGTNAIKSPQYNNGAYVTLPINTWQTVEVYIDYNNSTITFSLPTMNNYTVTYAIPYSLSLGGTDADGNPLPDDSPEKFLFRGESGISSDPNKNNLFYLRVDNINFVAQNTLPPINLGFNEQLAQSFNLYPNPATNIVNITNSENINVEQVVVYDVTGKQLSTQTFNNEAEIQLNVENLASGTYMLHITTNQGTAVKKLVKQ